MSDLVAPTQKLLADGPLPLKVVAERLKLNGQLNEETLALVEEEGDEVIGYELEYQLDLEDSIWMSGREYDADRILAWGGQLLDRVVLTHRLTAHEVAGDEVTWWPDLGILDWAARCRLETSAGESLRIRLDAGMPGDDASVCVGPKGWLAEFTAGDLVAFRRRGVAIEVFAAEAPAAGRAETEALRTAAERWIQPGEVDELFPVMADALIADGSAFREPVRPVVELRGKLGTSMRVASISATPRLPPSRRPGGSASGQSGTSSPRCRGSFAGRYSTCGCLSSPVRRLFPAGGSRSTRSS